MIFRRAFFTLAVSLPFLVVGRRAAAEVPDETTGPRGFVRLMNAVSQGTGRLDLLIGGIKVRDEGYGFGDVTGGIPRKPDTYRVACRREGLEGGETELLLVKDETTTLIPFAEWVPATGDKAAHWRIRILRLKQMERKEHRTATIVNVTSQPELKVEVLQKDGKWEDLRVRRLGLERTILHQGSGYVPLRSGGVDLKPLSVGSSGNFVSVIYEDAAGAVRSQNFQDYRYLSAE